MHLLIILTSYTINDVRYHTSHHISLPYNKKYTIKVYYVGINFSDPEKVYYSTYLENYDNDWSKMITSKGSTIQSERRKI